MSGLPRERLRDGLLAGGVLGGLVGLLFRDGNAGGLRDPRAAGAGVAAALLTEWAFLCHPERLLALWERPAVNRGSALAVLAGGLLARRRPRVLAAGVWGLATYLVLLLGLARRTGA